MKFIKIVLLSLISVNVFAYQVYDTVEKKIISKPEFLRITSSSDNIVIGEFHYDNAIQKTEAFIIEDVVKYRKMSGQFSVAWEFLNYPAQNRLSTVMTLYKSHQIKGVDIIKEFFPGEENTKMHSSYIPLFRVAKKLDGQFVATNAPREWKKVITKKGIQFLEISKVPTNMSLGSKEYLKRFTDVMGGHVTPEQLKKYFVAQSYTDAVISSAVANFSINKLNFLIIGSFHSDFNDGVVKKLNDILSTETLTIKVINPENLDNQSVKE